MKPLAKSEGEVLEALTHDLEIGAARKIDRSTFMAVCVDRLSAQTFSIAHYFKQNGDLVCDPDAVYLRTEIGWFPVSLQLAMGHYARAVELDDGDKVTGWRPRQYKELASFATMWMRNIRSQQGGLAKIRESK